MSVLSRRLLAFLPFVAVTALHLVALFLGNEPIPHHTKGWLMATLLVGFLLGQRWSPERRTLLPAMLCGIGFSWVGDTSLLYGDTTGFLTGLGAFLLAHAAYLFAFFQLPGARRPRPLIVVAYLIYFVALLSALGPETNLLLAPVAMYGFVLVMTGMIGSTVNWLAGLGGALFVVSDSVLGANKFLPGFAMWQVDFVIMIGYTGAQLAIVLGVLRALDGVPGPAVSPRAVTKQ